MDKLNIKQDCRYFISDRPCKFHKKQGVICGSCPHYSPVDKKILIIKLDALGDVLRTMAILPPLKIKFPNSHITWITRENALPLFQNVEMVDEVLNYTSPLTTHLLQSVSFDLVINPDANKAAALLASFARTEKKHGFVMNSSGEIIPGDDRAREWFLMGINDEIKKQNKKSYQHIILEMLDLAESNSHIPILLSSAEIIKTESFREENKLDYERPVIGLNVGAGGRWQNKIWPVQHYDDLISKLLDINLQIILLGGPEEKLTIGMLKDKYDHRVVSGGHNNSLRDFFSILNACDVLVSSDTMAAHAGLALRKKIVVFLGPTSINEFETYGQGIKLHADMDCLVCYRPVCDKKPNCMDLLSPEVVQTSILNLLR